MAAKKKAAKPRKKQLPFLDKVKKAFEEKYAAAWAERIQESPHVRQQLMELCYIEMQLEAIALQVAELMDSGVKLTAVAPNGVEGKHPLLDQQSKWRKEHRDLGKSLNIEMASRTRNRNKSTAFAELGIKGVSDHTK